MSTQQKYPVSTLPPLGGRRFHAHRDDVLRKLKQVFTDAVERLDCGSLPTSLGISRSALPSAMLRPDLATELAEIDRAVAELKRLGFASWRNPPNVSGMASGDAKSALAEYARDLRGMPARAGRGH